MKSLSAPLFDLRKIFFLRTEMDRLLASSMCFSCMLVIIRIVHSGRPLFIFMIWNLFLAYIPYALSTWLTARYSIPNGRWPERSGQPLSPTRRRISQILLIGLSLVWLLFIPNTFYILTDLYHLTDHGRTSRIPEWYDLVLIVSFAWNGLLLGVLSVRHMERLFMPRTSVLAGWFFVYPIMMLNSLGVYTGRYLRYNSWDIISDPLQLLADILDMIIHPFRNHPVWIMIFCFSILLTLIYRMFQAAQGADGRNRTNGAM
jgi:uncharacterized membrane protein